MHAPDLSRATWRKSSYRNGTGGSCVEIAVLTRARGHEHDIAVRDSKDPHGPVLTFAARQWREFTAAIKAHELVDLNHAKARPTRGRPLRRSKASIGAYLDALASLHETRRFSW